MKLFEGFGKSSRSFVEVLALVLIVGVLAGANNGKIPSVEANVQSKAASNAVTARMSAFADTRDWDPLGSSSLSSVNAYSQLYNQIVQFAVIRKCTEK